MSKLPLSQVDVFSPHPYRGNPVAVVHDADQLTDEQMATFARWTNLSETTFLLQPTDPTADYRLRIFTPGGELPFAGHPTLGSCHAWRDAGGVPRDGARVLQECAAGLIPIRTTGERLAFAAPPLVRSGPLETELLVRIYRATGLTADTVVAHQWVDNGPQWCALLLESAERVLAVTPEMDLLQGINLGLIGPHKDGGEAHFEVRAFVPSLGVPEDPVTGSLNAGLAQWLMAAGEAPASYVAAQGSAIGRIGRIYLDKTADDIWVGGTTRSLLAGTAEF